MNERQPEKDEADLDILIDSLRMDAEGRVLAPAEWALVWKGYARLLGYLGLARRAADGSEG